MMRKLDGLSPGLYPKLQPSFAFSDAVKRRAKLSGAYLAEYKRALAWAALATAEWAATGSETARLREGLAEVLANLA